MAEVNFEVDTDRLRGCIKEMREQLHAIKVGGTSLITAIEKLESMWEGPAKEAFSTQCNMDYERFNALYKSISDAVERFDAAVAGYESCDAQVYEIIEMLKVGD